MKYALINANILDGTLNDESRMLVKHGTIIIEDGKFSSVLDDNADLSGIETIDVKDKFVIPGLINLHVHIASAGKPAKAKKKPTNYKKLFDLLTKYPFIMSIFQKTNEKNARDLLYSGVTTIRTVGGVLDFDGKIRDKINDGKIDGPRILACNTAVSVPGGHFAGSLATEAETPEMAREHVRQIAATNPDWIKLMITGGVMDASAEGEPGVLRMKPEIVKAACDEAHRLGYRVAAHIECTEGVKVALENGVDTIEHGAAINEDLIKLFKERNAVDVCTLSPAEPAARFDETVDRGSEIAVKNTKIVLQGVIDCARACLENGIPVGMGTDTGCPCTLQYDTWRELGYWVKELGVTPDFALYSATLNNAKILGIDSVTGSIENGKDADFVVIEKNPLEDFTTLRKAIMVATRGKLIKNPKIKKNKAAEDALDNHMVF